MAFTHLNRLCAFKMMERCGLLDETVSRGFESNGFKVFLAARPEDEHLWRTGDAYLAYRHFLFDVCGQLAQEVRVLFDTEHVSSYLFPTRRALEEVLSLINAAVLDGVWDQDETLGWVYQYFTPKDLRDQARKESTAPRNSYELAFRNQFYTPRYVAEFLGDNTLGRLWFEMRAGKTHLAESCRYLVRRKKTIFLKLGDAPPTEPDENIEYISFRRKKLPWDIRVLDLACGSGHLLLYAFDLLETIYGEAYEDPDLGPTIRRQYPDRAAYQSAVPGLILRHNLHGIDIDLRTTQIASLALWLRAQRSYRELGLLGRTRPQIRKANIVCAEPMPGDAAFLEEFSRDLHPSVLKDLLGEVVSEMRLAGEAGSLLKIERALRVILQRHREEWRRAPRGYKISLFEGTVQQPAEQTEFVFPEVTDPAFWSRAESQLLIELQRFAAAATNGRGYGRKLFAEDAEQGFAFLTSAKRCTMLF